MAIIDNLVSAWEMDEASGNAIDSHGSHDLTDTNAVGASGGWRDFERDNVQYFVVADHADLRMGDFNFTIEAWVNMESKAGTGDLNAIVQKGDDYLLFYDADVLVTDRFAARIYDGSTFTTVAANNLGSPSTSVPYQLVMQYDATANEVSIKVNDGTANTASHANGAQAGTTTFRLGIAASNAFPFDGLMRRVRMWKRKLASDELTWLYNSGTGRFYAELVAGMGGGSSTTDGKILIAPVGFS
jgi:hypothetical protein